MNKCFKDFNNKKSFNVCVCACVKGWSEGQYAFFRKNKFFVNNFVIHC